MKGKSQQAKRKRETRILINFYRLFHLGIVLKDANDEGQKSAGEKETKSGRHGDHKYTLAA